MKALEILNNDNIFDEIYVSENNYKKLILEAIKELEELENKSCDGCKHLEKKEKNLKFECLIEVCRTCNRSNIDRYEPKEIKNEL